MGFLYLVTRVSATIFLSLILGALAMVYVGIEYPQVLNDLLDGASNAKVWLTSSNVTGIDVHYNVWFKFIVKEEQFVFMFFVVVTRILLLVFFSAMAALYRLVVPAPA